MLTLSNAVKFQRPSWWPHGGWRLPVPPRRVVLWSVVSSVPMAVVILVGAYLSHNLHVEIAISRDRIEQTHQVLGALNQLFISLQDAETGQRGFIITGEDSYLTPYADAVTTLAPTLARLRELTDESATQSIRIGRLQTLVDAKLAELGRTIVLRRTSGFQVAAADVARGDGKDLMDDVRREVELIGASERTLLLERQRVAQAREREVLRVGLAIALMSVGTRISLALILVKLRKRRAAANLKAAIAASKNIRQDEARKLQG